MGWSSQIFEFLHCMVDFSLPLHVVSEIRRFFFTDFADPTKCKHVERFGIGWSVVCSRS